MTGIRVGKSAITIQAVKGTGVCQSDMRSDPPGQVNETKERWRITPNKVTIGLGCEIGEEIYRSRGRGRIIMTQYERWRQTFTVPGKGYKKVSLTCPICHRPFEVKVHSKSRTRLRKLYFASCFLTIAAGGIVFGVFAGTEKGLMGYSLAAPFICFTVWQFSNAIRGRFDPSDFVSHAGGKIHRIFDEQKIAFRDP